MVLQGHVTSKNHDISTTRVPIATKLGRMITYLDGLLPIKSCDPLITCPCEAGGSLTKETQYANALIVTDFLLLFFTKYMLQ